MIAIEDESARENDTDAEVCGRSRNTGLCQRHRGPKISSMSSTHFYRPGHDGSPPRTIQELAGHADLKTTLKYMHLAEGETDRAIRILARRDEHIEATAPGDQAPGRG